MLQAASESRLRFVALVFYVVLWVIILGCDGDGRKYAALSGLRISAVSNILDAILSYKVRRNLHAAA